MVTHVLRSPGNNDLREFPPGLAKACPNLTDLNLSGNNMVSIAGSELGACQRLTVIKVWGLCPPPPLTYESCGVNVRGGDVPVWKSSTVIPSNNPLFPPTTATGAEQQARVAARIHYDFDRAQVSAGTWQRDEVPAAYPPLPEAGRAAAQRKPNRGAG